MNSATTSRIGHAAPSACRTRRRRGCRCRDRADGGTTSATAARSVCCNAALVDRFAGFMGAVSRDQPVRARQTADMAGGDMINAGLHGFHSLLPAHYGPLSGLGQADTPAAHGACLPAPREGKFNTEKAEDHGAPRRIISGASRQIPILRGAPWSSAFSVLNAFAMLPTSSGGRIEQLSSHEDHTSMLHRRLRRKTAGMADFDRDADGQPSVDRTITQNLVRCRTGSLGVTRMLATERPGHPLALFIPGVMTEVTTTWVRVIPLTSLFNIIAFELPGHGISQEIANVSTEAFALEYAALIDRYVAPAQRVLCHWRIVWWPDRCGDGTSATGPYRPSRPAGDAVLPDPSALRRAAIEDLAASFSVTVRADASSWTFSTSTRRTAPDERRRTFTDTWSSPTPTARCSRDAKISHWVIRPSLSIRLRN